MLQAKQRGNFLSRQPATGWIVMIVALAALVLRSYHLSAKSFSPDESFSAAIIELKWAAFWHLLISNEANMALYYLLLRLWRVLGESPAILRALSLVFGVATIPVIYALGRSLFSRRAGLISAFLLGVNTFHIFYSQNARSYSLLVLLISCSCLLFIRSSKDSSWRVQALYILSTTAALYSHLFAALIVLVQFVGWLLLPARLRAWSQLRNIVVVAVLGIPLLLFISFQGSSGISYHLDWAQSSRHISLAKDVYHFINDLAGNGLKLFLFLSACALACREWLNRKRDDTGEQWVFTFLALWLLLPVVLTLVSSHWKFLFVSRFLIICLPPAVLLFGEGLALIRPNWLCGSALAVTAVASLVSLRSFYRQPAPYDWASAINYLVQNARSGDVLVFANPYCRYPFEYNLQVSGKHLPPMVVQYADPGNIREFPAHIEHVWVTDFSAQAHHHWATLPADRSGLRSAPRFRFSDTVRFPGVEIEQFDSVEGKPETGKR